MAMKKIKRDDEVVVIAGKDKGKRGKVLKVLDDNRLLVSGVQIMKKHQKPNLRQVLQAVLLKKKRQSKFQMSRSLTVQQTKRTELALKCKKITPKFEYLSQWRSRRRLRIGRANGKAERSLQ